MLGTPKTTIAAAVALVIAGGLAQRAKAADKVSSDRRPIPHSIDSRKHNTVSPLANDLLISSLSKERMDEFRFSRSVDQYTFGISGDHLPTGLDGIKFLASGDPPTERETKFDVSIELQGVGLQLEKQQTYGYFRADRAFSTDPRIGIKFRFRF